MKNGTIKKMQKSLIAGSLAVAMIMGGVAGSGISFGSVKAAGIEVGTYESKLPVIYIETEGGANIVSKDYYIDATMTMQGNDEFNDGLYSGVIEIKGRGNSTWGMPKKPYKIKLDKSTNIWGMGKNKHWVLLANYSDPSLMRNTISYNLSGDMGMPQMDTTWVDVVLNGKYVGNYQFCEQIRIAKDRVNIYDWETAGEDAADAIAEAEGFTKADKKELEGYMSENLAWTTSKEVTFNGTTYQVEDYCEIEDISGGYLLELDEYYDEISKFKTDKNQPLMFKKPEFANTNKDMMNFVQNYIQGFEDAVYSDNFYAAYNGKDVHYSELFDMDSLVDYWIVNEVFYNEEFNKKSTYLYKDIDGLFHMGPIWDMDYSSGGEGDTYITNQWATKAFSTNAQAYMWYKQLIEDPYFMMRVQERYWEIRDTLLEDIVKTGGKIDAAYDYIYESAKKNEAMWKYKNGFEGGVNTFKTWLKTHLAWMDIQLETEDSFVRSLNAYNASTNISMQASDENGTLKVDNISKHAAADAVIEDGKDMTLAVSISQQDIVDAAVYVNGTYCKKADLNDGSTQFALTAEELSAKSGEKDVIRIDGRDRNGKVVASNYMTVLEYEVDKDAIYAEISATELYKGETADISGTNLDKAVWTSSNESVAVVEGTKVKALSAGTTVLTVSDENGKVAASFEITVTEHIISEMPKEELQEMSSSANTEEKTGEETGSGVASAATDGNSSTYWHSQWEGSHFVVSKENPAVLTVDFGKDLQAGGFKFQQRSSNSNGIVQQLGYRVLDADGNILEEKYDIAAKDTNNGAWNEVIFGQVSLARKIEIIVEQGQGGFAAIAEVLPLQAQKVADKVNLEDVELEVGETVILVPEHDEGTILKGLVWSSSDEEVVTVDENGTVTAVKEGTAVITASNAAGSLGACTVTVFGEEEPEIADKSKLETLIAQAEAKELDDYTQESVNTLLKTIKVGREVMKDANSSQGMVDLTVNMIQAALNGLTRKPVQMKPADKTALQEAITFVEEADLSIYTEQSVEILRKALDAAYAVIADEELSEDDQAVVDRVKDTLVAAFETLVLKETPAINKDALKKLIDKSVQFDSNKDLYIEESFNVFKEAYDEAVRVYQDEEATQEEVDEARVNLEAGRRQLREKPNKDKLEELIAIIKTIDFKQYSKEEVKAVKAAYASAVAVLSDEKATQTQIDKAVEKLEMTVNSLDEEILANTEIEETKIAAGAEGEKKENKTAAAEKSSSKADAKTAVKTGDKLNSALPATACLTAILAAVILYRRRRYHA